MIRLSASVRQRMSGFARGAGEAALAPLASSSAATSSFVQRAAHLKSRFRGKAQFSFARAEAQRFLDAEVPKVELGAWMEQGTNAVALAQVMMYFEVEMQDDALLSLLLNKLVRTAEASSTTAQAALIRMEAALALLTVRPEENYERACATVDDVLRHLDDNLSSSTVKQRWHVLDHCAKVLQRCGRRVTTDTNARLVHAVMAQIQRTPLAELSSEQSSLLRIYSWMSRADVKEADDVLKILLADAGRMRAFEFSTMMGSAWRHHQFSPLSVDTMKTLARDGLQYCTNANGRDIGVILGTVARLLSSAQQSVASPEKAEGTAATAQAVGQLADRFAALLEDYKPRVLALMDPSNHLFWKKSEDIVSAAYAYELGGRARHRAVFLAFQRYVQQEVATLEPAQLALTVGVLHRSLLLSADLQAALANRLEVVLGELRLPELSHVCAALTAPAPSWIAEAEAVAQRLVGQAEGPVSAATYLQLALAFPHNEAFTRQVNYAEMTARQLMDSLLAVLQTPHEAPVTAALAQRLTSLSERFTPDDIHLLLSCQRRVLVEAAGAYLRQRFAEPEWATDTLFCMPLAGPNEASARNVHRAMQAAASASVSPELFVSLVELLTAVFGATEEEVATFARKGGADLLAAHNVLLRTVVRYLTVVRRYPSLLPSVDWLRALTEKVSALRRPVLRADELENLLIALHTIFRDCQQTPALQVLLSELVEVYVDSQGRKGLLCAGMAEGDARGAAPSIDAARVMVLIAHLQRGMSLPLLTESTPIVCAVREHADTYTPDVQQALLSMPLPPPADASGSSVQRGRFTLRRRPAEQEGPADVEDGIEHEHTSPASDGRDPRAAQCSFSQFTVLEEDPFAMDAVPPAVKATQEPPAPSAHSTPTEPEAPATVVSEAANPAVLNTAAATEATSGANPDDATVVAHVSDEAAAQATEAASSSSREGSGEAGSSYYAKFFHKTVGQILNGNRRADAHAEAEEQSQHSASASAATEAAAVPRTVARPHRTSLRPLSASATPAPASESSALASDSGPAVSGASAFEKLFGEPSGTTANTTTTAAAPVSTTAQPPAAAVFAQLFSSAPEPSPAAPLQTPPQASPPPSRPPGGHHFFDPANPTSGVSSRPPMRSRLVMTRRPLAAAASPDSTTAAPGMAEVSIDAASGQGPMVNFMNQAGLSKVTGYDVAASPATAADPTAASPASAAPVGFSPQAGRLAWQETARQLARVTRRQPKVKASRGRVQTSLSEWLNKPDATLEDAEAVAEVNGGAKKRTRKGKSATAAAGAESGDAAAEAQPHKASTASAHSTGRGRKTKAAAAATTATSKKVTAAAKGKRGGGSGAGKSRAPAKATKSPKSAKPAKAAKGAKKPAAAAKPKKAASGNGTAAKKPAAARKTVKKAAATAKPKKAAPKPKAKAKASPKGKGKKK